ncbi:MAG: GtrA family protein [Acidocella sp.]|nr:GtrA family protein [Acidocella sp.]
MIEKTSPGWLGTQWNRLIAVAAQLNISADFIRFGVVGSMGFCWDTATVYALKSFINLYIAGAAGFFVAASANWAANRFWTFAHKDHGAMHVQWMRFLATNTVGFVFNRGVFFILITVSLSCRQQPVYAIIAGSFAGLGFNYFLSKRYVFT